MFRDSDHKEYVPHYLQKPVPSLQLQSQISRFDENVSIPVNSARNAATTSDIQPKIIPTTNNYYYEPSHPDAGAISHNYMILSPYFLQSNISIVIRRIDWSGMVSLKYKQKKHEKEHISQRRNIIQTEAGIAGNEEDYIRPKREINRDSGSIIGGIESNDHWKTEYRSLAAGEETSRSQLTLQKRNLPRKAIADPAQAVSGFARQELDRQDSRTDSQPKSRAPTYANKSLISGLGAALAGSIDDPEPASRPSSQQNSKVLLTENYNTAPGRILLLSYVRFFPLAEPRRAFFVGYTGRKQMF